VTAHKCLSSKQSWIVEKNLTLSIEVCLYSMSKFYSKNQRDITWRSTNYPFKLIWHIVWNFLFTMRSDFDLQADDIQEKLFSDDPTSTNVVYTKLSWKNVVQALFLTAFWQHTAQGVFEACAHGQVSKIRPVFVSEHAVCIIFATL